MSENYVDPTGNIKVRYYKEEDNWWLELASNHKNAAIAITKKQAKSLIRILKMEKMK